MVGAYGEGACAAGGNLALDRGKDAVERRLQPNHLALHGEELSLKAVYTSASLS